MSFTSNIRYWPNKLVYFDIHFHDLVESNLRLRTETGSFRVVCTISVFMWISIHFLSSIYLRSKTSERFIDWFLDGVRYVDI